jgi:BirA family biotin operon repressor/biotin-[acetyl-CoA-carboxylase] ligase
VEPQVSLALRRRRHEATPWAELSDLTGLASKRLAAAVEELARRGYLIESHPHLGLRLVEAPPSLDAEELAWGLEVRRVGRRIQCVDEVSSTNDLAWEAARLGPPASDGLAVFAEHQTEGRGRRGNRWLAPPHTAILCSALLWMPRAAAEAGVVTRAAAVAAAWAIEDQCDLAVGIKWPNDIVIDGRKAGGILVEARPGTGDTTPLVLGIGINCSQRLEAFPPQSRSRITSLAILGAAVDRTLLARSLLERLDLAWGRMAEPDGLAAIRQEATRRCRTLGNRIAVVENGVTYAGEVVDLDPDYGLVLRLPGGALKRMPALTSHVVPEA